MLTTFEIISQFMYSELTKTSIERQNSHRDISFTDPGFNIAESANQVFSKNSHHSTDPLIVYKV